MFDIPQATQIFIGLTLLIGMVSLAVILFIDIHLRTKNKSQPNRK